jgi:hypothetical protein
MWMPRLLVLPLLVTAAACTSSPAPRDVEPATEAASPVPAPQPMVQAAAQPSGPELVAAMTERCRATVAGAPNATVPAVTKAAQMRDDWVQVDGIVEWGEPGYVARHAWTCDMFRDEAGEWHRRYLSYGPVT